MKNIPKHISFVAIGALLMFIFFRSCQSNEAMHSNGNDRVRIDTIVDVDTIPGEVVKIKTPYPVAKYIDTVSEKLKQRIAELKDDNARIRYLYNRLKVRVYDSTYHFDRGKLRVRDTVQGTLLGREVELTLHDIKYKSNTIVKTIEKYPDFSLSVGVSTGLTTDFKTRFDRPYLGVKLGIENNKGYRLQFGYNTLEQFEVVLAKEIFVNY